MRGHSTRLAKLEQGLQDKATQLQAQAQALYERGELRHQVDATCAAVQAGDDATIEEAWQRVITGSREWAQLWRRWNGVCDALEGRNHART